MDYSKCIDKYCHSFEDNYMMELLAKITKLGIDNSLFSYNDLYIKTADEIYNILKKCNNKKISYLLEMFENIKMGDIKKIELPYIKKRVLNPLCRGERIY